MKLRFIHKDNNPRLILIFAGWGMDAGIFSGINRPGYDMAAVWDYRNESLDTSALSGYGEIALIAWSMGVFAADRILPRLDLPISATIAVNGTRWPADDNNGIPETVFNGTLEGLNERSLIKFYRRVCGSSEIFARFKIHMPDRDITELADELRAIKERCGHKPAYGHMHWDKAIVADNDAIIPTQNQINAWPDTEIHLIPGPHLPDWQRIIDTILVDKDLVHDRFSKGFATYELEADAQSQAAGHLWSLWQTYGSTGHIDRLIEIGYGTGVFTRLYAGTATARDWQLWDLVEPSAGVPSDARTVTCDAEAQIRTLPDCHADKIVSASTIQWFNSLPSFLRQAARALKHGGELIVSTFGPLTFRELAAAGAAPLPYPDTAGLKRYMAESGLKIIHISDEFITKKFRSPHDVLRHIRATGVNAVNPNASPAKVRRILSDYPCDTDGTAALTYQPIYIIATKE